MANSEKQILLGQRARRMNWRVDRGIWTPSVGKISCHPIEMNLVNCHRLTYVYAAIPFSGDLI